LCRIAGILNPTPDITVLQRQVKHMCDVQEHGGPDDEGFFVAAEDSLVLGHRRLSLLDLSQAGHQPMQWQERYTITYNGEIYNFTDLKDELHSLGHAFASKTDTEVILAVYAQWGIQGFARLQGMYAFALWDAASKELLLVRDPSGIKPLYYCVKDKALFFASEIKALQTLEVTSQADPHWPVFMMAYGHLPEPVTTLKDVKPVPKGCVIKFNAHSSTWNLQSFQHYSYSHKPLSAAEACTAIGAILPKAVKRHLIADAPIGVFLSGGIDSGIIAALASQQKKEKLHSLSLYFKEAAFSEKQFQDILIRQLQCKSHQYLLKEKEFEERLPQVLSDMDMPSCDGINTWFISKAAKEQGLKAVLSGIGADELLGGYPSFSRIGIAEQIQKMPDFVLKYGRKSNQKKLNRLSYLAMEGIKGSYLFLRGHFTVHEIAAQLNMDEKEVWDILNDSPMLPDISNLSVKNQASWMELNLFMQNQLLRDVDAMGMAHGIEIRVPFLDHDFMQLALSIPPAVKYGGALPKALLVESFKDLLPEPIWDRPKMGFSFPFKSWIGKSSYVEAQMMQANAATRANYQKFKEDKIHWSQLLSLQLINHAGQG
jgi:asparagine synthase (glutamine-hydrolysing)